MAAPIPASRSWAAEPPQQTVCSLNPHARVLGAERGMTLVEVETLPPLQILTRALRQEEAARLALLECAGIGLQRTLEVLQMQPRMSTLKMAHLSRS